MRRRFGDEVLEVLVEPLVGGINAGEADALSVDAVVPQLADRRPPVGEPRRGRCEPPRRPTRRRPGRCSPRPPAAWACWSRSWSPGWRRAASTCGSGSRSTGSNRAATGGSSLADDELAVDAVIVADAGAGRGRPRPSPRRRRGRPARRRSHHASVVLLTLAVPAASLPSLETSGFLVPRRAGLTITATSFASTKWAHLADPDTAVLRASCGHRDDPAPVELADDELVDVVAPRPRARCSASRSTPTEVRISRYPDGFPQYDVGHLDRVAAVEGELA